MASPLIVCFKQEAATAKLSAFWSSLEYFNKPISKLNYAEASILAMLPKAPSRYNPFKNKELAKFRRNLVIKNLFDNSYIDKDSYNKLVSKDIILNKRKKSLRRWTTNHVVTPLTANHKSQNALATCFHHFVFCLLTTDISKPPKMDMHADHHQL